MPMIYETLR